MCFHCTAPKTTPLNATVGSVARSEDRNATHQFATMGINCCQPMGAKGVWFTLSLCAMQTWSREPMLMMKKGVSMGGHLIESLNA